MASRKKLTARQRKAHKRASYIRSEYFKTVDALSYMARFTDIKDFNIVSKPTSKSLKKVRKLYNEARKSIKPYEGTTYIDITTGEAYEKIPTKKEMVKAIRSEPTQQYRQYRAEPEEAPQGFSAAEQQLEELIDKIRNIDHIEATIGYNKKTEKTFDKSTRPRYEQAKEAWASMIEDAIKKYGAERTADLLADNPHIQKIDELSMKYAYEIGDEINDNILPWLESSIANALH